MTSSGIVATRPTLLATLMALLLLAVPAASAETKRPIRLKAEDGYLLSATLTLPSGPPARI